MSARRISGVALALTLVVAVVWVDWALTRQQSERVTAERPDHKTTLSEQTTPLDTKPAASLPAADVRGKDIPDLPRYLGSVRVEYQNEEQNLLLFTRVRYLSHARVDVIRAFYRGVFRAEGWKVANVEFSEGKWNFLVVQGEREADIEIEPHGRDVTKVDVVLSEPLSEKETPPKRDAKPAAQKPALPRPSQSATPTPQSASPAPDDDYYEGGGEDGDDGGGGGDD